MNRFTRLTALTLLLLIAAMLISGCQHRHKFSNVWSCDYSFHWRDSLCDHPDETADKGMHSYNDDDICTVCGDPRPATMYIFPVNGNFHTELQSKFLADDYENVINYARGDAEKSLPNDIGIHWVYQAQGLSVDYLKEFALTLTCDKCEIATVRLEPNLNEYGIQEYYLSNAYLNTTYDVKVQAIDNFNDVIATASIQFKTIGNGPRNLTIDGVTNARDLGGYITPQGEIKQGLLLRTARLNRSAFDKVVPEITGEGIDTMLYELKVKTEIDLRGIAESSNLTASVLGSSVNYYCMNMSGSHLLERKDSVKQTFDLLCDKNNYPVFFHCHIGTDRTGFIAFLCLALLGADEQTLYVDYLFSNFGHIGGARWPYTVFLYIEAINAYEGDTFAQKTEQYLYECGVTAEQIAAFRDIMLEK